LEGVVDSWVVMIWL